MKHRNRYVYRTPFFLTHQRTNPAWLGTPPTSYRLSLVVRYGHSTSVIRGAYCTSLNERYIKTELRGFRLSYLKN